MLRDKLLPLIPTRVIKAISRQQFRHPILKSGIQAAANLFRDRTAPIQRGAGKGLLFNAARSNAGYLLGTTEPELQACFELFVSPGHTVYDIGSNVGFYTIISGRLVGPTGRVDAFDPLPDNAKRTRDNAAANRQSHVRVHTLALSDEDGVSVFRVSEDSNWGRLDSLATPTGHAEDISVPTARIDTLVANGDVAPPDVVKMDVEGAEVMVLRGARNVLRTHDVTLLVDIHGTNAEVQQELESCGYEVFVVRGQGQPLASSRWDVQIVAVPAKRRDLVAKATGVIARDFGAR